MSFTHPFLEPGASADSVRAFVRLATEVPQAIGEYGEVSENTDLVDQATEHLLHLQAEEYSESLMAVRGIYRLFLPFVK